MSKINHTDIPTAGVFGIGNAYGWNPVKGCDNKSCFLHPKNNGKCWAASMCNRFAEIWAGYERNYIMGWDIVRENIETKLKHFNPIWFESQYQKSFPKKQSCILVGYMTDIAFIPREWVQKIIDRITQDNQERESAGLPLHIFPFLTKGPGRIYPHFDWPLNCWLGGTVTKQNECHRIAINHNPKNFEYVYIEPMLEKIDLSSWLGISSFDEGKWIRDTGSQIDWVIVGGGPGPVNPDWVRSIRDQCQAAMIPFYFKGWGKWLPDTQARLSSFNHLYLKNIKLKDGYWEIGKKYSGNTIDGKKWEQFLKVKLWEK